MGRRRIAGWEEQDVHTGWRRLYTTFNRAGQSSAAKRRTRRHERRIGERETRAEATDALALLDAYEEVIDAGEEARRTGVARIVLSCDWPCHIDGWLDSVVLAPDCPRHGALLDANAAAQRAEEADR